MAQSAESERYRLRAELEREIAGRSSDPDVKRIHENLARRYDALSRTCDTDGADDRRAARGGGLSGPSTSDGPAVPRKH